MRLDKAIASQGDLSRSEVRKQIKKGMVTVNGELIKDPGFSVDPEKDAIVVDGKALSYQEYVYYMLNKPEGVLSATEDAEHRTVLDLVPAELYRDGLFPAGRLDIDTTGFVLLTDDGALAHALLSPRSHVWKTYVVTVDAPIPEEGEKALREGISLKDGTACLPAEIQKTGELQYEIRIREGKYHEIKRMVAAAGSHVTALHRSAIGDVSLDSSLGAGELRPLTEAELKTLCFGSEN